MVADSCFGTYYCFVEADVASDPAFLENNSMRNLVSGGLYADRDTTLITTAAGLNSMTDITCSGNVGQADLRDAGTPVGAPLWDFLGNPRDDAPSIGATEP
jgi:hypothetical protein